MIFDHVDNREIYYGIDPRIAKAFDYYLNMDPDTPTGKYELDGEDFFVLVQRPEKKNLDGLPLEYHRKYMDLQLVVKGTEVYGFQPTPRLGEAVKPYNPEKDAGHSADTGSVGISASEGDFFLFWPQDGHKGCGDDGKPGELVKLCFKIRIKE